MRNWGPEDEPVPDDRAAEPRARMGGAGPSSGSENAEYCPYAVLISEYHLTVVFGEVQWGPDKHFPVIYIDTGISRQK